MVNFVMLNPSTADDVFDDPTIRKCIGFAKRWGFSGLWVTNLFAFRATNPKELEIVSREIAIGENNDEYLIKVAKQECSLIVVAWGNLGSLYARDAHVCALPGFEKLHCIQRNSNGSPVHPGRIGYTDFPIPFSALKISGEL